MTQEICLLHGSQGAKRQRQEGARAKTHSSKSCYSDLLHPAKLHFLIANSGTNASMDQPIDEARTHDPIISQ
jgi:hypothetical protein